MKKTWQAPQLVVLVRVRPEESVLAFCKTPSVSQGPNVFDWNCFQSTCTYCEDHGSS